MKKFTVFSLILCFAFVGFSKPTDGYQKPIVRVAVLKGVEQLDISVQGKYKINDVVTGENYSFGRGLKANLIRVENEQIKIGLKTTGSRHLRFISQKGVLIRNKNKKVRYRGDIDVYIDSNHKLLVVNRVDLERYVRGVLYHEVSDRWPMESMKAQAIAVRTYAIYRMKIYKDKLFDVTSDIYSQVYGGRDAERYRTNLAAKRTKGKVLQFDGDILPAYFHSNCGGHTENAGELWKHDIKALGGVKCPFCIDRPNYQWIKNFQSSNVQQKLNEKKYKIGLIKDIKIVSRTKSGRVDNLVIIDRSGKRIKLKGSKFREIIGPNVLKSNKFSVEMKGYFFDVLGKGWGHGVGMCQWGAHKMSKKRKGYRNILSFYYPGAQIVDYRSPEYNYLVNFSSQELSPDE